MGHWRGGVGGAAPKWCEQPQLLSSTFQLAKNACPHYALALEPEAITSH